jgi:hypothetical protein
MEFTTAAGFKTAWARVRGDILEANGLARDAKNVRLAAGCVVMEIMLNGSWVRFTDRQIDMQDRVNLNKYADTPAVFRLRVNG